jgi:hypothetical protein
MIQLTIDLPIMCINLTGHMYGKKIFNGGNALFGIKVKKRVIEKCSYIYDFACYTY